MVKQVMNWYMWHLGGPDVIRNMKPPMSHTDPIILESASVPLMYHSQSAETDCLPHISDGIHRLMYTAAACLSVKQTHHSMLT